MDDFLNALHKIIPAFGASMDDLECCRFNGIVEFGGRHAHIFKRAMLLAEQVKVSRGSSLVTCFLKDQVEAVRLQWHPLLDGLEIRSPWYLLNVYNCFLSWAGSQLHESIISLSESTKCAQIVKTPEMAETSMLFNNTSHELDKETIALAHENNLNFSEVEVLRMKMEGVSKGMLDRMEEEYGSMLSTTWTSSIARSSASTSMRIDYLDSSSFSTRQQHQAKFLSLLYLS
ncbi:hypothetical protein POM88_043561 [Heracleum sosnowskyi]|uniref:Uncharacterized protein n=1 Tax=Heracleum sosnowskyi TaxID=360622 RepID=A0AAD8M4E4_9APIA|nr:hypothetical protein POM88_043561 [Heracleum sosnowskyi]